MSPTADRTALIEAVVRERLPEAGEVRVTPGVDHEGDPVLRIRVVFDPDAPMDDGAVSDIRNRTWDRLAEMGDPSIPIFSWVTPRDSAWLDARVR